MEERKLNFNTPLISVRRFSTSGTFSTNRTRTPPSYQSDSNMEQVTDPVAVPFMWEQIPGIAKNRTKPEVLALDQVFEKGSEDRARTELLRSSEGSTRENGDEMEGTSLVDDNGDNDVYSDALESLSSAESVSFSFDCSVSGLSGSDGLARKPSGTFSVDPQTRDLMMSRFLPAARAMALEPPQYASRKQQQLAIVPYEQPKEVKREPVRDIKMHPTKYVSNVSQEYHEQEMSEEDEVEGENVEVDDDIGIVRGKGCGLIPKLCLLNPIPGMKVRSHNSFKDAYSQARDRPVKKNADYNYGSDQGTMTPKRLGQEKVSAGGSRQFSFSAELQSMRGSLSPFRRSRTDIENQHKSDPAPLTPKLHGPRATPFPARYRPLNYSGELRPTRSSSSPYRHSGGDTLLSRQNGDHDHRPHAALTPKLRAHEGKPFAGVSRRFNFSGELQTMRGSLSPYRHSRMDDAFTVQQNGRSRSPLAGVGALSTSREIESTRRSSSNFPIESRKDHVLQTSFGVEKTVYVDRVNIARNSYTNSHFSEQEVWLDPEAEEVETPSERTEVKEAPSGQFSFQELKSSEYSDSSTSRDLMILSNDQSPRGEEKVNYDSDSLPPLLKSPSESWLYRTLPSVPSRSPLTPKKQSPKLSSHETKWETIVKSSNLYHDHVRYSEELVTHVMQKSKLKY